MSPRAAQPPVRIAIVGAGAVSDYHHVPGIRLDPRAKLVAVADTNAELVDRRRSEWQVGVASTDVDAVCRRDDVDAVIIATPNFTHVPIALRASPPGSM
jgi:predicted dehydrogenase